MLREDSQFILPKDILTQINPNKFKALVVLGLSEIGEENEIWMSTLTFEELSFLSAQLQAHLIYRLGPMKEGN